MRTFVVSQNPDDFSTNLSEEANNAQDAAYDYALEKAQQNAPSTWGGSVYVKDVETGVVTEFYAHVVWEPEVSVWEVV